MTIRLIRAARLHEIWEIFRSITSPYVRHRMIVLFLLVLVTSIITGLAPVAIKLLIDGLTEPAKNGSVSVVMLVSFYILSQWLGRVITGLQGYVSSQGERRMGRALSDLLFDHVMRLPLHYHLERKTGAVSETLANGLAGYQMVLNTTLYTALPVVTQLATVTFVLLKVNQPILMIMFVVALVCYSLTFAYGGVRATRAARDASEAQIDAHAIMTDSILNAETVKYFTAEEAVRARLNQAMFRTEVEWLRFNKSRTLIVFVVATLFAAFLTVNIGYAAHEVLQGRMTIGTFVLVNTYIFQLVGPLETIGSAMQQLSEGFAFVEKMLDLLRQRPEPPRQAHHTPYMGPATLQFDSVGVSYRQGRSVLKDVSFKLPTGKTLGIVGASGAGKSTLVRLLVRLIEPNEGRVLIDDVPVTELPLSSLRGAISVVPQDTVLFNDTILYNIGFGKPGSTKAEIEDAAKVAGLHHFITSLPEGYDTVVGERGVKLSGGERQRVSIARAAIKRPRVYVFDEATSSLDSRTEREIVRNLKTISARSTTLIIAHRLSTVAHADEIVVLDDGAVIERGTHTSLLQLKGKYASLWQAQQQPTIPAVFEASC